MTKIDKNVKFTDVASTTHRNVATMLTKALPENGEDFRELVETYLAVIKKLPTPAKIALKSAYIFSRKVPREEREDLFQDIALTLLKSRLDNERLAYAIARCDWLDWWKHYRIRQHYSLDSVVTDSEGSAVALRELLVGEVEFERKINGKLDAEKIWNVLPESIKPIIQKRLLQQPTTNTDRTHLNRWLKTEGYKILLNS